MKLFPLAVIGLLLASACNLPQNIMVPVSYSPRISLNSDTTTIVVINRFDFNGEQTTGKNLDILKSAAFTALKYTESRLTSIKKVKVVNLTDSPNFDVNTDSVKDLAAKYHADYVLALKSFNANIVLEKIENNQAYYQTIVSVTFFLHEDNGRFYKELNGSCHYPRPVSAYPGFIASLVLHPTIAGSKSYISQSAQNAMDNALQDYLPRIVTYNRPLYHDSALSAAVKQMVQKNFGQAENLLRGLLKNPDEELASHAAYNLAVVYEAQGDKNGAIEMAQFSLHTKNNLFARTILNDLARE